jgi:hypothetical protein
MIGRSQFMLLERATGLADKINRYERLKIAASQAKMFRTRAEQLAQVRISLADARTGLEKFDASGVPVDFTASNSDELLRKAGVLKDLILADPTALADPPFNLKYDFIDRLFGICTFATKALEEAWTFYVARHSAGGSSDVLDALAKLPQFQLSVARIRKCRQDIEELGKRVPTDPVVAIANLMKLLEDHRSAWSELKAEGIPSTVIQFIRACAENGVPLSGLTEEVQTWLQAKHLLDAFRIRIG